MLETFLKVLKNLLKRVPAGDHLEGRAVALQHIVEAGAPLDPLSEEAWRWS